jgi:hypothetical protein
VTIVEAVQKDDRRLCAPFCDHGSELDPMERYALNQSTAMPAFDCERCGGPGHYPCLQQQACRTASLSAHRSRHEGLAPDHHTPGTSRKRTRRAYSA